MKRDISLKFYGNMKFHSLFYKYNQCMLRYISPFIFFLMYSSLGFSQSLKGLLLDENQKPVAFATLFLKNQKKGTISNDSGRFFIESNIVNDTLLIACLGFENKKIPVLNWGKNEKSIQLKSALFSLPETRIKPKDGRPLMHKLQSFVNKNKQQNFLLEANYCQYHFENELPSYLVEANLDIHYNPSKLEKNWAINKIRRSNNFEQYGGEHDNHLADVLKEDLMADGIGGLFSKSALPAYELTVHEWPNDSHLVMIYFAEKRPENIHKEKGFVKFDTLNFTIIEVQRFLSPNNMYNKIANRNLVNADWMFISGKNTYSYELLEGKIYLSKIDYQYTHLVYSQKFKSFDFKVEEHFELNTLKAEKTDENIPNGFNSFASIYRKKYVYDEAFWEKNKFAKPNWFYQYFEQILGELKPLKLQFKDNGL